MSIPAFLPNGNLPIGIHLATWQEVREVLGFNDRRRELLDGLQQASQSLQQAGCTRIYIGGSFVTSKEFPGDFDACYEDDSVDYVLLQQIDPVIRDLRNKRAAQKAKYGGELFPASAPADLAGRTFLEFFQTGRDGNPKGLVAIDV